MSTQWKDMSRGSDYPQLLFRDCQEERVDHNGPYLDVLAEPECTPRDPESGNNNQLSFTRSEHLDSISGTARGKFTGNGPHLTA